MTNNEKRAKKSLILGITSVTLGTILAFLLYYIPISMLEIAGIVLNLLFSIIGIIMGIYGIKSEKRNIGILGVVLSVLGLNLCVGNLIVWMYMWSFVLSAISM